MTTTTNKAPVKRAIKQERAARTRVEILEAAINLFGRRGILATTMSELAKAIRMTPGALYWHFPTKEDLLLAAVEELDTRYRKEFSDIANTADRSKSAVEQLNSFLSRGFQFLRYHREYGVFLGIVMAEAADEGGRVAEAVRHMLSSYVAPLAGIIRYGQNKTGEFRKDVEPEMVAHSLVGTTFGVVMYQNLLRDSVHYDPVMALVQMLYVDGARAPRT